MRHAVEELHDLVGAEALREGETIGGSRVGLAVADGLDERDEEEEQREGTGADPSVGERTPGEALAACTTVRVLVVVEEDLLERRLAARQRHHLAIGERREQRLDGAADLKPHTLPACLDDVHAVESARDQVPGRRR